MKSVQTPRSVLLLNSDLASNRGDRAIAEGIVDLVRRHLPEARITAISQYPERDREWYGVEILDMNFQSLDPRDMLRLLRVARQHDLVLWGGGEILKDYTNKAALWYWVLKIALVSLVNPRIVGAFQGIGPTKSTLSKRLIAFVVGRTRLFLVRDTESRDKLVQWGVPAEQVVASSDPAVVPEPAAMSSDLRARLVRDYGLPGDFFDRVICLGPRDWFHYRQSGILPFKYRRRLDQLLGRSERGIDPRNAEYRRSLGDLVENIAETFGANILLVPMHMDESDTELARQVAVRVPSTSTVCVLDRDDLSPAELRSVVAASSAMVGFRLHSNIIGVSSAVPSVNVYYVDKGRVFFDQIGMSAFAMPIEATLSSGFVDAAMGRLGELLDDSDRVRADITASTRRLRDEVDAAFARALDVA